MKQEKLAMLSPQDRQEYENSLKITKAPRRYALFAHKALRPILRHTPAL
jgi:hypothetical protein